MFCSECGMENPKWERTCWLCRARLPEHQKHVPDKIFIDITRIPFIPFIKTSGKSDGWLTTLLVLPFITIIYYAKKISGSRWYNLSRNSGRSRFKPAKIEEVKNLDQNRFDAVSSFLHKHGYEEVMDYENLNLVRDNVYRLMINSKDKTYAFIFINKVNGKIGYISFFGIWTNFYYAITNSYGLPISSGKNVKFRHLGDFDHERIYQEFLHDAKKIDWERGPRKKVSSANLFRIFNRINQFEIELGRKQHIYFLDNDIKKGKSKDVTGVSVCYFHSSSVAVRECSDCGLPLCDICYHPYNEKCYCEQCVPKEEQGAGKGLSPITPVGKIEDEVYGFAGFGIRGAAVAIDILVISLVAAGVGCGAWFGIGLVSRSHQMLALFLGVATFGVFSVYYLISSLKRTGRTLGHRLFRLCVVDEEGRTPDIRAAIVRFAYFLISVVFIFPVLGFLVVLFNKKKQGWHDKLAGTYVVAKKSLVMNAIGWLILLSFTGGAVWGAYRTVPRGLLSNLWSIYTMAGLEEEYDVPEPVLYLEPVWERGLDFGNDYAATCVRYGEKIFITTDNLLLAADVDNGKTIWEKRGLSQPVLYYNDDYHEAPLIVLQYDEEYRPDRILVVDIRTGATLWETQVDLPNHNSDMEEEEIEIEFNERILAVIRTGGFSVHDLIDGTLLWKREYDDYKEFEYDIQLNGGVITTKESDKAHDITYLTETGGDTVWKLSDSNYLSCFKIAENYQGFQDKSDFLSLMYLPEKKIIWKTGKPVPGWYSTIREDIENDTLPELIVSTTSVIDFKTGKIIYTIPQGFNLFSSSRDYLIFTNYNEQTENINENAKILIFDKATRRELDRQILNTKGALYFAGEEDDNIYFFFQKIPFKQVEAENIQYSLVILNKKTMELSERSIGENIFKWMVEYVSEKELFWVWLYNKTGIYRFPEISTNEVLGETPKNDSLVGEL